MAQGSLNVRMNAYRDIWMMRMLDRDVRIVDTQIMASLQNGTAFFASTSLIAIGGALTLMRSTDDLLAVASALPFGIETSRALWEIKTVGLAVIFAYAFFKFAWSYRLFNYVAILIGAMPSHKDRNKPSARAPTQPAPASCVRPRAVTSIAASAHSSSRSAISAGSSVRGCSSPPARRRHRDVATPIPVGFRAGSDALR